MYSRNDKIYYDFVEQVLDSLINDGVICQNNPIWDTDKFNECIASTPMEYDSFGDEAYLFGWAFEDLSWSDCLIISRFWRMWYSSNVELKKIMKKYKPKKKNNK